MIRRNYFSSRSSWVWQLSHREQEVSHKIQLWKFQRCKLKGRKAATHSGSSISMDRKVNGRKYGCALSGFEKYKVGMLGNIKTTSKAIAMIIRIIISVLFFESNSLFFSLSFFGRQYDLCWCVRHQFGKDWLQVYQGADFKNGKSHSILEALSQLIAHWMLQYG